MLTSSSRLQQRLDIVGNLGDTKLEDSYYSLCISMVIHACIFPWTSVSDHRPLLTNKLKSSIWNRVAVDVGATLRQKIVVTEYCHVWFVGRYC